MHKNSLGQDDWVPSACTLPTAEQPLRRAEFDALFSDDVLEVDQQTATSVAMKLRPVPDVASRAARLAADETACCSFFSFELTIAGGQVEMVVSTGPQHPDVLEALSRRANALSGATS